MNTTETDPLELLTLNQVSNLTKRSKRSLIRDVSKGELRTIRLGGSVRVQRRELERYLRERGLDV